MSMDTGERTAPTGARERMDSTVSSTSKGRKQPEKEGRTPGQASGCGLPKTPEQESDEHLHADSVKSDARTNTYAHAGANKCLC